MLNINFTFFLYENWLITFLFHNQDRFEPIFLDKTFKEYYLQVKKKNIFLKNLLHLREMYYYEGKFAILSYNVKLATHIFRSSYLDVQTIIISI